MTDTDNRAAEQARYKLDDIVGLWRRASEACDADDWEAQESAEEEAREMPLSVEVRSVWHVPGAKNAGADEYAVLLCTGGPAIRVWGKLDANDEPYMAVIESQDWFEPWREYQSTTDKEREALLWFAGLFYYGEG